MLARRDRLSLIEPDWAVPSRVHALVSTRSGGVSARPFDSLNLAFHVGDDRERVQRNRRALADIAGVRDIVWLDQEHGRRVLAAMPDAAAGPPVTADASWTAHVGVALAILVADCVPLLLAAEDGSVVAAAHCGWRGTVAGVVETCLDALPLPARHLAAWVGPGICGRCYQVGGDVRQALDASERAVVLTADETADQGMKWRMDLPALVAYRLRRAGVERIVPSSLCPRCDGRFFSYRRDGRTGRFAAMIWLE